MSNQDDIDSTPEGSDGEYSLDEDSDQLQPEDTLVDRGVDDVLDEGYSPPEHQRSRTHHGLTTQEQREGQSLDTRLGEEEPDVGDDRPRADRDRSGRLIAPDEGVGPDKEAKSVADDVGIDGGAASAEEAAVHYRSEDEPE